MGGEELNWRQLAHQWYEPKGLILAHTEKLKPKGSIAVSNGISHVAFASVLLGENTSEEVDDYDNYYYYYHYYE